MKEQACVSVCMSLLCAVLLEESQKIAGEALVEEADRQRVRQELSQRVVETVIQEVVDSEAWLTIRDTYRYRK